MPGSRTEFCCLVSIPFACLFYPFSVVSALSKLIEASENVLLKF